MALSAETASAYLTAAHEAGRLANVYLIYGAPGSGKVALARKLATLILHCLETELDAHPDFHNIQPLSKSRRIVIEQVRFLERTLQKRATIGMAKVAVIQDAELLAPNAANAFLKTLEEPPAGSFLVLLTIQPEGLLPTVLSRCMHVPLYQKGRRKNATPSEESVVSCFNHCLRLNAGALIQAFQFGRDFQTILAECQKEASVEITKQLSQEKQRYQHTTDGVWLEERVKYWKAVETSVSVRIRRDLIVAVKKHLAAGLRASHLKLVHALATISQENLLQQIASLDRLQWLLASGVSESLAFEVCFLEIFSVSSSEP